MIQSLSRLVSLETTVRIQRNSNSSLSSGAGVATLGGGDRDENVAFFLAPDTDSANAAPTRRCHVST